MNLLNFLKKIYDLDISIRDYRALNIKLGLSLLNNLPSGLNKLSLVSLFTLDIHDIMNLPLNFKELKSHNFIINLDNLPNSLEKIIINNKNIIQSKN